MVSVRHRTRRDDSRRIGRACRRFAGLVAAVAAAAWTAGPGRAAHTQAPGDAGRQPAAAAAGVTFTEHVAPIVFANCAVCHRPGEAAPFSLLSYEDVRARGRLIAEVTATRYMPPWHAAPGHGEFLDERRLADADIATIRRWVDAGMPEGDRARLPEPPRFPQGWQLGEPDLVVQMAEPFEVPADGPDVYRNFVVPLDLPADRWVSAVEFRPGARAVVHHALFFADPTGGAREADRADPRPGFSSMAGLGLGRVGRSPGAAAQAVGLGGWAVGNTPRRLPDGLALPLPKGSDLVLQMHFHPTGKREIERSTIGLHFADRAPTRTLLTIQLPPLFGFTAGVDIPAGEANYSVSDWFELPVDVDAYSVGAHAHYLGKEMKLTAALPGGSARGLLWIPDWNFAWQDRYVYAAPVRLPKGTRLEATIRWDNSPTNPRNPHNPPVRVRWGRESFDEMGSITLLVVPAREEDLDSLRAAVQSKVRESLVKRLLSR
jgi:mono/diheme cytochrome c family protein